MSDKTLVLDLDTDKEAEEAITGQLKSMVQEILQACVEADESPEFIQATMQESLDTLFTDIHETGALLYVGKKRLLGYTATVTSVSEDQLQIHLEPKYQSQQITN